MYISGVQQFQKMFAIRLFLLCIWFFVSYGSKVRIALAVDEHSSKEIMVLINSVIEASTQPDNLVFHIVACGIDSVSASILKDAISSSINSCFSGIETQIVAFVLPSDSGFSAQLNLLKKKSNHWNSQCGADMARFFLASLFPTVDRLLYLDNDMIVSCCLEDIYFSDLNGKIIGIALDDLNWATVTQFQRHYNASHPLVVKNMRRNNTEMYRFTHQNEPISKEEFSKSLPRYPNDGVILIDVQKYNENKILDAMNEIALANSKGEYVVNLGTQQFTVLTLFDRWMELTPRANLRHFPDMARGYLMWYYYNGFIHYAGQAKPRALCQHGNYKDNWLRVQSYTSWATSNQQVAMKCPNEKKAYTEQCVPHIPNPSNISSLMQLLSRIAKVNTDETVIYAHIGPLHGNLTLQMHHQLNSYHHHSSSNNNSNSISGDNSNNDNIDFIEYIVRYVLHESKWSFRNYECDITHEKQCQTIIDQFVESMPSPLIKPSPKKTRNANEKQPKIVEIIQPTNQIRFGKRNFILKSLSPLASTTLSTASDVVSSTITTKPLCTNFMSSNERDIHGDRIIVSSSAATTTTTNTATTSPSSSSSCIGLLEDIRRNEGKKHWDIIGITIDMIPPAIDSNSNSNSDSNNGLKILLDLDLIYMRPKFIIMRIYGVSEEIMEQDTKIAMTFMKRNGFIVYRENEGWCYRHDISSSNSNSINNKGSSKDKGYYSCIWGTRVNYFEIAES